MRTRTWWLWSGVWIAVAGCGGGGGGAGTGSPGASPTLPGAYGRIELQSHSPAADAVQVAVDAPVVLEFDSPIARDSLGDPDTGLFTVDGDTRVAGTFTTGPGGRVTFRPAEALERETDYRFVVSGLTCDQDGRILDASRSFGFRTLDTMPPTLLDFDVAANALDQSRTRSFTMTFDEAIAPASLDDQTLYLRDGFGTRYPAELRTSGFTVVLDPHADLPGDRTFSLVVTNQLADRAGNKLPGTLIRNFRTAVDFDAPALLGMWPANGSTSMSPRLQPTFTFNESMDPATVEAVSLEFVDQYDSVVPFRIHSSDDQRLLRLEPLQPLAGNRRYTIGFQLGGAAATDVSGNGLSATSTLQFTTGDDNTPPSLATSEPADGSTSVSTNAIVLLQFAETLDPAWVDADTVTMTVDGAPWHAVVERILGHTIRVTPVLALPARGAVRVVVAGGHAGVRDLAGNVLPSDVQVAFTASADAQLPRVLLQPEDGTAGVSTTAAVSLVFDAPMQTDTLDGNRLRVTDDLNVPVDGTWSFTADGRIARFVPDEDLRQFAYYRITVQGGSQGVRRTTGSWFTSDQTSRFRTAGWPDVVAPTVVASLDGIPESRSSGLVLPPSGFVVHVVADDSGTASLDMGSVTIEFDGPVAGPTAESLLGQATVEPGRVRVLVPVSPGLAVGAWTLRVQVADLSGNVGTAAVRSFEVATPTSAMLPFERTQLVWMRTDQDRDGNGRADFLDDLVRLGLATHGDPLGTNDRMADLLRDAILAQANHLYGRGPRGEPIDSDTVAVRFTAREPLGAPHMQMTVGGYDPEGDRSRVFGDESTGILGRAYYDYRNGNYTERNTSVSPGLGVFPGEMWLYQARVHLQVWPSFQTAFAQRFRPLCPDMGGTPAGSDPLDAIVLAPGFDEGTATNSQVLRYRTILNAADDWATVIGIVLAHEVGHSVGLVAPGPAPRGLFGDNSLHNTFAGAAEVMAASVGYEAMTTLDYAFRDIDLAYLRHRILLR